MKQKKLRTDILFLIISIVWTIIAGSLYLFFAKNENSDAENLLLIFKIVIRVIYFPIPFFPIVLFFLHKRSKAKGEGKPLSLEAMRESKKHIPQTVYKFCSLASKNSDDTLNNSKLRSLKNNEIWFSKCSDLNDPFEGLMFMFPEKDFSKYGLPEEIRQKYSVQNSEELINLLSDFRNEYCQTSFSSTNNDVQMWGYYANGCRGYCVEYNVLNQEMLFPVSYLNKRIILSGFFKSKKQERICRRYLKQLNKSLRGISAKELIQYYLYIQSFKYSKWSFEKEIRAIDITLLNDKGYNQSAINSGLQPIKIIAGYLSEYIEELKQIASQLGISFSIMKPNFESNKFELVEQKIL
ncbi:MAG: DUF2971 domain-containing protein [Clostridia bacterium]|nr:DUF2971 domain-containing protein [Clostridia bacterium]